MMLKIILLLALIIVFMTPLILDQSTSGMPKIIGWIPYWDQQNAFNSFSQNADKINFVSVFWYKIEADGSISLYDPGKEDQGIIDFARSKNVKILALIANLDQQSGNWDYKKVNSVISSEELRKKHIENLVNLVESKNFDGVDIDYESLRDYQEENFTFFIKELSLALHSRGKVLGVAIHPKTSDDNPLEDNGAHAQNLKEIGKYADQLYFMTYLEHGAFSEPGPISSIDWIETIMRYGLIQVPAEKAYMGVGLMGSGWANKNGDYKPEFQELTFADVYNLAQSKGITPMWDDGSRSPFLSYDSDNSKHTVWFENAESIKQRIDLAKRLGAGGVALWRLGNEDQKLWEFIGK